MKKINPLFYNIVVERNTNEYKGRIKIPDKYKTHVTNNAKILGTGDLVDPLFQPNDVVITRKVAAGKEVWKHPENDSIQIINQGSIVGRWNLGTFTAYGNNIVIERLVRSSKSAGGIIIPRKKTQQTLFGVVHTIGTPQIPYRINLDFKKGDIVKISKWHEDHEELKVGQKQFLIVNEKYMEAVIPEDEFYSDITIK